MGVVLASVSDAVIDLPAHLAAVASPRAGAAASFVGVIRDHDPEASGRVTAIEYTSHPDAEAVLLRLAGDVLCRLDPDDEARVAVTHRIGRLTVGDLALVCCVATPHRRAAFALCEAVVEEIKSSLPVWKRQFEADGRAVWSGLWSGERTP